MQLFGCKTWRLGDKPAVEQPSHNCVLPNGERHVIYDGRELEAPTRMRTYNLFPGDWLLVPKGVWHETTTTAGSVSATLAAPEGSSRGLLGGCPHRVVIGRRVTPCSVVTGPLATKPNLW